MALKDHIHYRPDIDGLRAVAILSVVLFHCRPEILRGGFTGVDIFFVISGYLISGILIRQQRDQTFRFLDFYSRRIKRLFPAMLVTLSTCTGIAAFFLFESEFKDFGSDILAASFFASNIKLYFDNGYFDKAAEMKPLLHLWSLGLEEQFYLLWPLLLFLSRRTKKLLFAILGIGILGLLGITLILIPRNSTMAFYFPNRFWELLIGAFLAAWELDRPTAKPTPFAHVRSLFGIGLIAIGIFGLEGTPAFPGWPASIPTFGATLLLSAGPKSWANRWISNRVFIGIGLISYPLYLWHWPLLYFVKIASAGDDQLVPRLAAMIFAAGLAWLTYEFVEKTLRTRFRVERLISILLVAHVCLGLVGWLALNFGNGRSDGGQLELGEQNDKLAEDECLLSDAERPLATWCLQDRRGPPNFVVYGDSHAEALYPGLLALTQKTDLRGMLVGKSSCSPLSEVLRKNGPELGIAGEEAINCRNLTAAVLQSLGRRPQIKTVILVAASRMLNPYTEYEGSGRENPILEGFSKTIRSLTEAGKKVLFVIDNPEITASPELCLSRPFQFVDPAESRNCSISRADYEEGRKMYTQLVSRLKARFPNMAVIDPTSVLCTTKNCPIVKDGKMLYSYTDHLNDEGNRLVAGKVLPWIRH